jgi:hypothetical protein
MSRVKRSLHTGVLGVFLVVALIVFIADRTGYGQSNGGSAGQAAQCQPFQRSVRLDLLPGSTASTTTISVTPRTTITIEQIGLRIDAQNFVAPSVAAVLTSVRSNISAYYVPIPNTLGFVLPPRPLTLMQAGPLHADGGTNITFTVETDNRYLDGIGRAEFSLSGQSCVTVL